MHSNFYGQCHVTQDTLLDHAHHLRLTPFVHHIREKLVTYIYTAFDFIYTSADHSPVDDTMADGELIHPPHTAVLSDLFRGGSYNCSLCIKV